MNLRFTHLFLAPMLLAGCLSATPDSLLSEKPLGQAQTSGQFPIVGRQPVGETVQMTPAEKARLQTELAQDAQLGQRQAENNSEADYQREVALLRWLAKQQEEEMRQRIEGEPATQ